MLTIETKENGFNRPVLKHGPRSLTYVRVLEWRNSQCEMKVKIRELELR